MEFRLSDEHKMLRQTVREFRDNEMRPLVEELDPDATHLPKKQEEELRETAKEHGLWAMGIPEEYGGGGLGVLGRTIVLEELVQHPLGLYNPGLGGVEVTPGITVGAPEVYLETATDYQLEEFIEPAMRGERSGCFALTGPEAGSDPGSMSARAVKDGDEWVLNGEKRFITAGGYSDYAVVFAKAVVDGEEKGVTTFIVDTDTEAWNVHRRIDVIRPKDPFEIHMDDLRIPDRNRFGEVGQGYEIAASGVRSSRIGYSAAHIGICKYALEMGLDYVKQRETFGKPLSERQAIRWMLADSAVDIHTARLALYDCAWKAQEGIDVRHEASIAKLKSAEVLNDVLDRVIQMHGGLGVSKDLPLERWYREARVRRIGEGPSEIQRRTIARNLVEGYEPVDLLDKIH